MASSNAVHDQPKQWGVTRPRSCAYPTEEEYASTRRLVEVLSQSYPRKSKEERNKQKAALEKLENIVKDWVRKLPNKTAKEANSKLFSFGSYRMQVDEPGSIIDTLCVGPEFVNREDHFFNILRGKLERMSEVIGMESVHDPKSPFLRFKLDGVAFKLFYASLHYSVIPEELNICDDSVIASTMDDIVTFLTLSGCRITESILDLIPNLENFRTTFMCVKHWANVRCIWSNVSGFLGEREWSVLVARVCQAYPHAAPSRLVTEFFDIFATWPWPNPIMLCPIEHMGSSVWDPKLNKNDREHCMPIICPVYPHGNLRTDATTSTLRVMKAHFEFGDEKCKAIRQNIAAWEDLFEPFNFFDQYFRYLHIDLTAASERNLLDLKWFIESELRLLISQIEENKDLTCHPCPIEYTSSDSCAFFVGLSSDKVSMGQLCVNTDPAAILEVFQRRFEWWESRTPDMKMHVHQVLKQEMGSQTWGKHLSLVVGGMPAPLL